jgi:hypothetical protein
MDDKPQDWWSGADVCVALVPEGQAVDWSPGKYVPHIQTWVPEETFIWITRVALSLGLRIVDLRALALDEQSRLSAADCTQLLARWSELEDAVSRTPADGWAAAIKLTLQACVDAIRPSEVLIEGP